MKEEAAAKTQENERRKPEKCQRRLMKAAHMAKDISGNSLGVAMLLAGKASQLRRAGEERSGRRKRKSAYQKRSLSRRRWRTAALRSQRRRGVCWHRGKSAEISCRSAARRRESLS